MQLINTAIPLFLVVLQLATIGRATGDVDDARIYHCACNILLQLHELIHLLKGNPFRRPPLVSPSDEYLRP